MEKDALAAIDAAKTACPSQSGSAYSNCVLQVLPFTSINLTELANWTTVDTAVINVLKDNKYSDSASQFEPISGKVTFVTGASTGQTGTVTTSTRKANTGLLDLAQPSISSTDSNVLSDTQGFVIGVAPGPVGGTQGYFWVNHPSLAKGTGMFVAQSVNSGASSNCNYDPLTTYWKCGPTGDKALWSGILNSVALDITGYNTDTADVSPTVAATTAAGACTYSGTETGFPTKQYVKGTSLPLNTTYIGHTCGDYNITSPATNTTTSEVTTAGFVITNSGKKLESTHIVFPHVAADPDDQTDPKQDVLTLVFTGPTNTAAPAKCTYSCSAFDNNGHPSDCKTAGNTSFSFTAACP